MKKLFMVIILFSSILLAQEETLLGGGQIEHGGFGGPVVKFTSINNQFGVLVGGRGGWIINHSLVIGGGGYGLVNEVKGNENYLFNEKYLLNFGYGGFEIEFILDPNKAIHGSAYLLLGGGAVNNRNPYTDNMDSFNWDKNTDAFFVAEPAINLELNIIHFMRLNLGLSYRFISGVEKYSLTNSNLAGGSAILTFKFGKF